MVLGIPVVDGHELTNAVLDSLAETITGDNFRIVIIDNGSDRDYSYLKGERVDVIRNKHNIGYYRPLQELYAKYPDEELIGLAHNDLVYYEKGWNGRMEHSFAMDEKLALVGLCGSNEIDGLGGRGGGTVCFFRGGEVKVGDRVIGGQSQAAGRRTIDLIPSACLDSLFMMFRRSAIPDLVTEADPWEHLTLAHFYDRIWPVRLVEKGWHVATLGVECDHLGGMTTAGNMRYRNDCIAWLDERGLPYEDPETEMYLVAERRYLGEYRDAKHFIPMIVHGDYSVQH